MNKYNDATGFMSLNEKKPIPNKTVLANEIEKFVNKIELDFSNII